MDPYIKTRDVKLEMTTLLSLMVLVHIASVYSTGAVWNPAYVIIVLAIFVAMASPSLATALCAIL